MDQVTTTSDNAHMCHCFGMRRGASGEKIDSYIYPKNHASFQTQTSVRCVRL